MSGACIAFGTEPPGNAVQVAPSNEYSPE